MVPARHTITSPVTRTTFPFLLILSFTAFPSIVYTTVCFIFSLRFFLLASSTALARLLSKSSNPNTSFFYFNMSYFFSHSIFCKKKRDEQYLHPLPVRTIFLQIHISIYKSASSLLPETEGFHSLVTRVHRTSPEFLYN